MDAVEQKQLMESLLIKGGVPLHGEVKISGSKNAVLPLMAATLLTGDTCVIRNVPDLSDVAFMVKILQSLGVDYIDESEVLTPADEANHIDKYRFSVPFVCGATNLGEALRRIGEGAAMIRSKGEAGTGDIVNAVTHMRSVFGSIRRLGSMYEEELYSEAKRLQAPYELVKWVAENGRLPVVTFTAGGIATPADAALCMQLGADGVFVIIIAILVI